MMNLLILYIIGCFLTLVIIFINNRISCINKINIDKTSIVDAFIISVFSWISVIFLGCGIILQYINKFEGTKIDKWFKGIK